MARKGMKSAWFILVLFFIISVQPFPEVTCSPRLSRSINRSGTTIIVNISGDGNYTHIQWAIDNATEGDTVYVEAGTYFENIVVNKSITLMGSGQGNTTINGSGNGDAIYIGADDVSIIGFNLTNNGTLSENAGIRIRGANGGLIKDNLCYRNLIGISIEQSGRNTIINNNCSNNVEGIRLSDNSNENYIANNSFTFNRAIGIFLSGYSGPCIKNSISNNTFRFNDLYDIYLRNSDHNELHNNDLIVNHTRGIYLWSSDNNTVAGNTMNTVNDWRRGEIIIEFSNYNIIKNNNLSIGSIRLTASNRNELINNTLKDGMISVDNSHHNKLANNFGRFLHVTNSNWNVIRNNTCSNSSFGIYLSESHCNTIINNNLSSNRDGGILLGESHDNIVSYNTCENNRVGIRVYYSNSNTIQGNICQFNFGSYDRSAGIGLELSNSNIIENNTCNNNNKNGIFIEASHYNTIFNNTCLSNRENGIFLKKNEFGGSSLYDSNCTKNKLNENTCNNNTYSGINLSHSSWNTITKNTCESNGDYGIYIDKESIANTLSDNLCDSNGIGNIYQIFDDEPGTNYYPLIGLIVILFLLILFGVPKEKWKFWKRK